MAGTREQLNVQVTSRARQLAKTCAAARQKSLNVWVESAILEKAARDGKTFNLDAMNKALKRVAKRYLPGKAVTPAQMLKMAQRVAAEDTEDGFRIEHYSVPPLKGAKPSRSRRG